MSAVHTVTDRLVVTYQPDGWARGVLTGVADGQGGFGVEHVIVFNGSPPTLLMDMLRAGLQEAWNRGFAYVTWRVPHVFPAALALAEVGRRLGFTKEREDDTWAYFRLDK